MNPTNKVSPLIPSPIALPQNAIKSCNENHTEMTASSFTKDRYNTKSPISNFLSKLSKLSIHNIFRKSNPHSNNAKIEIPPELVDIILKYITKNYISIESTKQLLLLMQINHTFFNRVKIILKDADVAFAFEKDKNFIKSVKKLLKYNRLIKYKGQAEQSKWCKSNLSTIAENYALHQNQIVYGFKKALQNVQHIKLNLSPIKNYTNREAIFTYLSQRKNLKSLDLYIGYENSIFEKRYAEMLAKVLNNNPKLVDIPYLGFGKNTLDIKNIDILMQALLQKNIGLLSFNKIPIKKENAEIFAKYLKNLNISYLSVESAGLGNEEVQYLIKNLPKNIKSLSLINNNFDKDTAKFIFENLQYTKIEYVYLSNNNLSGLQPHDLQQNLENSRIKEISLIYCDLYDEKNNFIGIKNKYENEVIITFENRHLER